VVTGHDPVVQFLCGFERRVPGDTLQLVPRDLYEAEVENRRQIGRFLDQCVDGIVEPDTRPVPRPPFDLEAAMRRPLSPVDPRPYSPDTEVVPDFIVHDLKVGGSGDSPLPVDPCPVRVIARRLRIAGAV
jgi:hypothetical protein